MHILDIIQIAIGAIIIALGDILFYNMGFHRGKMSGIVTMGEEFTKFLDGELKNMEKARKVLENELLSVDQNKTKPYKASKNDDSILN